MKELKDLKDASTILVTAKIVAPDNPGTTRNITVDTCTRARTNAYICASIQNTPTRPLLQKVTVTRWPKGFPPLSEPFHPAIKIQTTLPSLRSLNSPCYCCKGIRSPYDCHVFKKKVLCFRKFRPCVTLYGKKWHTNRPKIAFARFTTLPTMLHLPESRSVLCTNSILLRPKLFLYCFGCYVTLVATRIQR